MCCAVVVLGCAGPAGTRARAPGRKKAARESYLCSRGGRCGRERPAEEGTGRRQLDRRLEQGGNFIPHNCALRDIMGGIMSL